MLESSPRENGRDMLDLGALRAADGYFLSREAPQLPFPSTQSRGEEWEFGSTYRHTSDTTLRDHVLDLVRGARQKVFITSYVIGDDNLAQELVNAADRLTGGVYVISELSERTLLRGLTRLANPARLRKNETKEKVEVEKKRFLSLTTRGVAVRGHENCHAKFVVVDDEIAWVGSANLETEAFTTKEEIGVITRDPAEVSRLARLFARMWLSGCKYELPSATDHYSADERDPTPAPFAVPPAEPGPHPAVIWTDDTSRTLLAAIHDIIASARRRLVLASYSLKGMDARYDLLIDPIKRAIDKGVQVRLLVRAMNWRDDHRHDAGLLHSLGVHLLADDANHAKAVVADDQAGALFSANFDYEHGLDPGSGIEVGARLDGTTALPELTRYLNHALDCATREYVHQPTARQLHDRLAEDWQRPWPEADQIKVRADANTWTRLKDLSCNGAVLWHREKGNPVELYAGAERFRLKSAPEEIQLLEPLPGTGQTASEFIRDWWRRAKEKSHEQGYCPALIQRI